jgi:microcystin-dependent protein
MIRTLTILTLALIAVGASAQTLAPGLVNYQGSLRDSQGQPLATADYEIAFQLYDDHQAGSLIWGPQTFAAVPVAAGHFNVILGPVDDAAAPLTEAFEGEERFLEITVNGDTILPRQQILSAPYALSANLAGNGSPPGSIIAYGGDEVPEGWLLCDGSEVSREAHPDLFAAIGTAWGDGDGAVTFNLPDLRGRFPRGVDHGAGRDPNAGSRGASAGGGNSGDAVGTVQSDATARPNSNFTTNTTGNHTHGHPYRTGFGSSDGVDRVSGNSGSTSPRTSTDGNHSHSVTGGGDAETRPLNAAVEFIIKH